VDRVCDDDGFVRLSRLGDLLVVCGNFKVELGSHTQRLLAATGTTDLVTSMEVKGARTVTTPTLEGSPTAC